MNQHLKSWLAANKIRYQPVDTEVLEVEEFGRLFIADLSGVKSIFRQTERGQSFNLLEDEQILMGEGIYYVAFLFGKNWYYYDIREPFKFNILKYIGLRQKPQMDAPFVNLGVHTPFELLNGAGDILTWVLKAKYLGHTALGICDRHTLAGALTFQKECFQAGIKPVIGYSLKVEVSGEQIDVKIYCQEQHGLQNLLRIQKSVLVDNDCQLCNLEELFRFGYGNVLVFGKQTSQWLNRNRTMIHAFEEIFDDVYYQVDLTEYKADRIDSQALEQVKCFFDNFYDVSTGMFAIKPILICDTYYPDRDDARSKYILNKIATGVAHEQSEEQYFKDTDEHFAVFQTIFDPNKWNIEVLFRTMCEATVKVSEGARARFETERSFMPRYKMTKDEIGRYEDRHNMFLSLLEEGFLKLVPPEKNKLYRQRLEHEIYILESTDNVDYMLVQYDTVKWARNNGILVGCGRGSAGGCLALYLLGITLVDPIKYNLLFERFLLPERAGLYPANVTKQAGHVTSENITEVTLENGKTYRIDRDAQLLVERSGENIVLYADQLIVGDSIIFDNREILFSLDKI